MYDKCFVTLIFCHQEDLGYQIGCPLVVLDLQLLDDLEVDLSYLDDLLVVHLDDLEEVLYLVAFHLEVVLLDVLVVDL